MSEELISLEQLEEIFYSALDPLKVDEVTKYIDEQIKDPEFIHVLLALSNYTNNDKVLLQCSIQCFHAIKIHWKVILEDFQQKVFNQILYLIDNTNYPSYFSRCISFIISNSSMFHQQLATYMKNTLESPDFENLMNNNTVQFNSFFKIFVDTYFACLDLQQIDFSPLVIYIMENPALFSPQIKIYCLNFLTVSLYVINQSKNEEVSLNLEKYFICYHLYCNMPYQDIFVTYWSSFFDIIESGVLSQEDLEQVFQKAYQIVIDPEIYPIDKILILSIYSGNLQHFQRDFVLNLFEISFNTCTQILQMDGIFPVDQLSLFEPFLNISIVNDKGEEFLDVEFISVLYSFVKNQILSEQPNVLILITSLAVLTIFMINSPELIRKDFDFFIEFETHCIDSNFPVLQEMACYLIENMKFIKSKPLKKKISKIVPNYIQKIISIITSGNTPINIRFNAVDALFSLYDIASSDNSNYNSSCYEGIYNQIIQSQNLFPKDNYDSFVSCQTISIFLDPTVTNDQLIEAYKFVHEVLTNNNDDNLMSKCFILFNSILFSNIQLKRRIDFDYSFTIPIIQSILTDKKDSISLIKSLLRFINNIVFFYKKDAIEFESACIELLVPFFSTVVESGLKIELINIISNASKHSLNAQSANIIITSIFELINSDRLQIVADALMNSQKLINLLNSENLHHLFDISMTFINHNDNKLIVKESILIINKIVKFYLSTVNKEGEGSDSSLIDAVHNLIKEYIDKNLKYQIDMKPLKVYYCLITNFCELISTIWNFPSENNAFFFGFLINYIQSCLAYFEGKNIEKINVDKFKIHIVIGCLADGIKLGILTDQELFINLTQLIPTLASPQISTLTYFDMKQNLCFLLCQILKIDFSVVTPFIDQFLSSWFQECLQQIKDEDEYVDDYSVLLSNISFLFFEIYGKTKPVFPSSHANELLITSIELFPPMNHECFDSTKTMIDSIFSNFFSNNDVANFDSMIHNTDNGLDMLKIYSSFALSFMRLLKLDKVELAEERDINEQMIEQIQKAINFLVTKDKQIESIVIQNNPQ